MSVPMLPPAPGRLSTTTCCANALGELSARSNGHDVGAAARREGDDEAAAAWRGRRPPLRRAVPQRERPPLALQRDGVRHGFFIPAQAGIQKLNGCWMPASAGMNVN